MEKVIGKVCPAIHLNEEVAEFRVGDARQYGPLGRGRPGVGFHRRQHQPVVFHPQMTVLPCQKTLNLRHRGFQFLHVPQDVLAC